MVRVFFSRFFVLLIFRDFIWYASDDIDSMLVVRENIMVGKKDDRHKHVLECLSSLPRKILSLYERDDIPEFVLQDICSENCFNIMRAAYFIDNPDFNSCKGVAGFCRDEAYRAHDTMWQDPASFSKFMHESLFNNQVRGVQRESIIRNNHVYDDVIKELAPSLGFVNPAWCNWHLKYYNEGLIVYEKADFADETFDEHFMNTLYVLGFCAIR